MTTETKYATQASNPMNDRITRLVVDGVEYTWAPAIHTGIVGYTVRSHRRADGTICRIEMGETEAHDNILRMERRAGLIPERSAGGWYCPIWTPAL